MYDNLDEQDKAICAAIEEGLSDEEIMSQHNVDQAKVDQLRPVVENKDKEVAEDKAPEGDEAPVEEAGDEVLPPSEEAPAEEGNAVAEEAKPEGEEVAPEDEKPSEEVSE